VDRAVGWCPPHRQVHFAVLHARPQGNGDVGVQLHDASGSYGTSRGQDPLPWPFPLGLPAHANQGMARAGPAACGRPRPLAGPRGRPPWMHHLPRMWAHHGGRYTRLSRFASRLESAPAGFSRSWPSSKARIRTVESPCWPHPAARIHLQLRRDEGLQSQI
jgi:hypothetical protein